MAITLDIKRSLNLKQITEIYKFEIFLQKKRYLLMMILSLAMFNLTAIFAAFFPPPEAISFIAGTLGQTGSFLLFITLFFAGGILADEFDKRTALTNFTKTGRDNFFIGKTLAAFTSVLVWIGPIALESVVFCLLIYQQVPIELLYWFGYYCLVGGMYVAIYLLHSAIFRSGSQAMIMGFMTFIATTIAFGLFLAFLDLPYLFPIYAEIAAMAIFYGNIMDDGLVINLSYGIIMAVSYLIPCLILSYLRFRTRDV